MAGVGEYTGIVLAAQIGGAAIHGELSTLSLEVHESEVQFLAVVTILVDMYHERSTVEIQPIVPVDSFFVYIITQLDQQTVDGWIKLVPQLQTVTLEPE